MPPQQPAGFVPDGFTPDAALATPTAADMLSRRRVTSDAPDAPPSAAIEALRGAAHPQTLGDIVSLLIPAGEGAVIAKGASAVAAPVAKYGGAALDAAISLLPARTRAALEILKDLKPSEWHSPLTVAGREARASEASAKEVAGQVTRGADMYNMRSSTSAPVSSAPPASPAASTPVVPASPVVSSAAPAPSTPSAAPVPSPPKIQLSGAEYKEFARLLGRGLSGPKAMEAVLQARDLASRLGTPALADVETTFPKGMRGKPPQ